MFYVYCCYVTKSPNRYFCWFIFTRMEFLILFCKQQVSTTCSLSNRTRLIDKKQQHNSCYQNNMSYPDTTDVIFIDSDESKTCSGYDVMT